MLIVALEQREARYTQPVKRGGKIILQQGL